MSVHHFFSAPIGTYGNALVNWASQPTRELIAFAGSYRNAAMNLVAYREQLGIGAIDHSALPILFLYRHSFELYLKAIVFKAAILSISEAELGSALPRLWKVHSLLALVEMAKPVLAARTSRPLTSSGELEQEIIELAGKIDEVDRESYSFRYPVTSQGQASLPTHFLTNVFVFSEEVERVLDSVVQFCRSLDEERVQTSEQMKLALHPILAMPPLKKHFPSD